MKNILAFAILFSLAATSIAQNVVPSADEILKTGYAKAGAENKKLLLIFHASWCGWCRKMDSSLNDAAVKALIDKNYEIAHLTVYESQNKKALENKGALEFITQHGGADKGIPYWYILDKDGNVLADSQFKPGQNTGCPASEEEVAYFINVLKKTSSLQDQDLEKIRKRFRQNEQ